MIAKLLNVDNMKELTTCLYNTLKYWLSCSLKLNDSLKR